MSEQQLSFEGFEPSPKLDVLFFASVPSAEVAQQIVELRERLLLELNLAGHPIARERLHVSLRCIGAWHGLSPAAVKAAKDVGNSISKCPFEIVFERAMSFVGSQAFVLCARTEIPLMSFHRALGIEMKKAGIGGRIMSGFVPHMTLLYGDRMVTQHSIKPVRWTVRDLVLVQSLRGRSKHVHLEHWPLR